MQDGDAAEALAALGNTTRLKLFRLLVRAGNEGASVGQIQRNLEIPASTLAHHLSSLTRAGLVVQERQGREVISRVDFRLTVGLVSYLTDECCTGLKVEREEDAA